MRKPPGQSWILFGLLFAAYWLFPAGSILINQLSGDGNQKLIILVLVALLPIFTAGVAFVDGLFRGFGWWWALVPLLCFMTTLFVFYNESAFIYGVAYSLFGIICNAIGGYLHTPKLPIKEYRT